MRFFTSLLTLILIFAAVNAGNSQTGRYLKPVFTDVTVSSQQVLQANYTVMPWVFGLLQSMPGGGSQLQPLRAQFYSPTGDTETKRPLIIYLHTGNFIPFAFNGACGGTVKDSSNVEIATRLAKMGYVVAVVEYRQGWLPTIEQELLKRYTLINAAYRGVQDVNTYIRYFKGSAAATNPHGIDPEKIVVWGQGTGGYLSLASGFLNEYNEILETSDPNKFRFPVQGVGLVPMVTEQYNGNIEADGPITTSNGQYIPTAALGFRSGDTLCRPNHVGINSKHALTVNMGGALGDSTWIDAGEPPLISFHVLSDAFAPCKTGILRVPTLRGPEPVVEVSGSCDVANMVDRLGINNVFKTIPNPAVNDPFNSANKSTNSGFFQFSGTPSDSGSPWEWASLSTPKPQTDPNTTGCNTNGVSARMYIDTIVGYFAPRACVALGLNCFTSSTKDLTDAQVGLVLAPNPASLDVTITTADNAPMKTVTVYDITGRVLAKNVNIDQSRFVVERNNLNNGLYFVKIDFDKGSLTKKIIFE